MYVSTKGQINCDCFHEEKGDIIMKWNSLFELAKSCVHEEKDKAGPFGGAPAKMLIDVTCQPS